MQKIFYSWYKNCVIDAANKSDDVIDCDLRQETAGCVYISANRVVTSDWLAVRKKRAIGQTSLKPWI